CSQGSVLPSKSSTVRHEQLDLAVGTWHQLSALAPNLVIGEWQVDAVHCHSSSCL
ncbi:hypothetical protein L208DRAFT_1409439, partial [Tricholoma matsutake]